MTDIHDDIQTMARVFLRQTGIKGTPRREPGLSQAEEAAVIRYLGHTLPLVIPAFGDLHGSEREPEKTIGFGPGHNA